MENIYSNAEDCANLAIKLNNRLYNKISFYGSIWQGVVSGTYHAIPLVEYTKYRDYLKDEVNFNFKYRKDKFLRITIGKETFKISDGMLLAVLSDFCEVLTEYFGSPSFFYTIKDDDFHTMNIQWSYDHVKEDIEELKNGCYFDDAVVDKLIIFEEQQLSGEEKQMQDEIAKKIGLPYELFSLVEENMDDFLNAKLGKKITKKEVGKKDDGKQI